MNERGVQHPIDDDEDLDTQMLRRIRNMKAWTTYLQKAKKKKPSKNKRCSKPPTKVEKEKHETFTETFQEVVDKKDHGIHEDFQLKVVLESDMKTKFYGIKTFFLRLIGSNQSSAGILFGHTWIRLRRATKETTSIQNQVVQMRMVSLVQQSTFTTKMILTSTTLSTGKKTLSFQK